MTEEIGLIGRLYIRVLHGRNLIAARADGFSDPYCRVSVGGKQVLRSKTCRKTLDPVWGDETTVNVESPFDSLVVEVLDEEFGKDEFMGYVSLRVSEFADQKPTQSWFELKKKAIGQSVSGDIELSVHLKYHAAWQAVFLGDNALQHSNYGPAVRLLSQAIDSFSQTPYWTELCNMRCIAYMHSGKLKEALQDAAMVLKRDKLNSQGWYNMGMVYFTAEDYAQARQAFERGAQIDPNDTRCAQALRDLDRNAVSQKISKSIAEAREKFKSKDFMAAVSILSQGAIDLNPQNHIYYWYRALAYLGANELEKAEVDMLTVVRINPQWPKIEPARQGELKKQGDINILFKRRWFYLKSYFLFYYKNKDAEAPQGVIIIYKTPSEGLKEELYIKGRRRTYRLKGSNAGVVADWARDISILARTELTLPLDSSEKKVFLDGEKTEAQERRSKRRSMFIGGSAAAGGRPSQLAGGNISQQGFLHKQGEVNNAWKRRYFILKWQQLFYFKEKPELVGGVYTNIQGVIQLDGATVQYCSDPPFSFQILPLNSQRSYFLYAETDSERLDWFEAISASVHKGQQTLAGSAPTELTIAKNLEDSSSSSSEKDAPRRRSATVVGSNSRPGSGSYSDSDVGFSINEPAPIAVHERLDGIAGKRLSDQDVSRSEAKYFSRYGLDVPDEAPRSASQGRPRSQRPNGFLQTSEGIQMQGPVDGGSRNGSQVYDSESLLGGYSVERDYEEEKKCCSCTIV